MKQIIYTAARLALGMAVGMGSLLTASAEKLVILHTNDTHSMIDPASDGMGGALQRKAIIDSVRKAEKNVLLVDAGDAVQGTLYFNFFKGEVEEPLMNMMGYDVQILGNHEFDNGMEALRKMMDNVKAAKLSANYDFTGTPLEGVFEPYVIKKVGGKKVGFIGLNIDPSSIIAADNYKGLKFKEVIPVANQTAEFLKDKKGCDIVVAVTHIGAIKENDKTIDYELAAASKDIDIIIGGHSHTIITPGTTEGATPAIVNNAEGRPVLVCQTGRYGKYLGYIKIDLDKLGKESAADFDNKLIPVTDRFPESSFDKKMVEFIAPYKAKLKEADEHVIGYAPEYMDANARTGRYVNWAGDFVKWYGDVKADSLRGAGVELPRVDFGMMNVGGIRHNLSAGDVTEGKILATFPFSNHVVLTRIKGKDFIEAMRVAARKGGEAISDEIRVVSDPEGNLLYVLLNDEEMDPEKDYLMSTIDYLAWGNDDFVSLANGEILWRDTLESAAPIMRYIGQLTRYGLPVEGDPRARFVKYPRSIANEEGK